MSSSSSGTTRNQTDQAAGPTYIDDQHTTSLPLHVNDLRKGLLSFKNFVSLDAVLQVLSGEGSDENDLQIPLHAFKTDILPNNPSQRTRDVEFLKTAKKLTRCVERLDDELADDCRWVRVFRATVDQRISDFHSAVSVIPPTIVCAENEPWDTDFEDSDVQVSSKPDFCCGFPLLNDDSQELEGFGKDSSSQNYTIDTLSRLAAKGLRSVTISSYLDNAANTQPHRGHTIDQQLCFPWCIFQLIADPIPRTIEELESLKADLFRRASMASSDALIMLENLAQFADVKDHGQHIPPVISITSVSANTTVWLTYSVATDHQRRTHEMVSIWEGNVSKIWDAIQFCRILENLFTWSLHILKPKVTQYIDQWKFRHFHDQPDLHSRLQADKETAGLVDRIQDRLGSFGIPPIPDVSGLIQQAVILQEVMRSSSSNPKSSPGEQKRNLQDEVDLPSEEISVPEVRPQSEGVPSTQVVFKDFRQIRPPKYKDIERPEQDASEDDGKHIETVASSSLDNALVLYDPPQPIELISVPIRPKVFESPRPTTPDSRISKPFTYSYEFQPSDFDFRDSTSRRISLITKPPSTSLTQSPILISRESKFTFDGNKWRDPWPKTPSNSGSEKLHPRIFTNIELTETDIRDSVVPRKPELLKRYNSGTQGVLERLAEKLLPVVAMKIPWKEGRNIIVRLPRVTPPALNTPNPRIDYTSLDLERRHRDFFLCM